MKKSLNQTNLRSLDTSFFVNYIMYVKGLFFVRVFIVLALEGVRESIKSWVFSQGCLLIGSLWARRGLFFVISTFGTRQVESGEKIRSSAKGRSELSLIAPSRLAAQISFGRPRSTPNQRCFEMKSKTNLLPITTRKSCSKKVIACQINHFLPSQNQKYYNTDFYQG